MIFIKHDLLYIKNKKTFHLTVEQIVSLLAYEDILDFVENR